MSKSSFTPAFRAAASHLRAGPSRKAIDAAKSQARNLHVSKPVSATRYSNTSVDPRVLSGSASFLPKENVDRLQEWQAGLWERLAAEVRNNPALLPVKQKWNTAGLDMAHLLSFTARDPALTLAFNYASLLVNNSYFLESINPEDQPQSVAPHVQPHAQALLEKLEGYAEGIVGGGWLWLARVGDNHSDLDIIPTFASGTLLITQRTQIGREDIPYYGAPSDTQPSASPSPLSPSSSPISSATPTSSDSLNASPSPSQSSPVAPPFNQSPSAPLSRGQLRARTGEGKILPVPLAVLNLYELAWLGQKYGVWGKKAYARDWWSALDWGKVAGRSKA